jgi:D-alanyl-D-alanine dipeptidase
MRACLLIAAATLAAVGACAQDFAKMEDDAQPSLVHLREIDASILQDIRYAGSNNFTGKPVPGYAAPECLLLRDAAEALSRVQRQLRQRNLSLKVYDCYRPRRAVRAFRAWVRDPAVVPSLKRFHPNLDKTRLIDLGYIAAVSRHSRGDAVDLTLVALPAGPAPAFMRNVAYGPCNGPEKHRAPDNSVDMGTSFDCFDPSSHTAAPGLSREQARWRRVLIEAMASQGFRNYPKEWWHFTYRPERRGRSFDVPVVQRRP